MQENRSGWLGDFTGFSLQEESNVQGPQTAGNVALTPLDLTPRLLAHMQVSSMLSGMRARQALQQSVFYAEQGLNALFYRRAAACCRLPLSSWSGGTLTGPSSSWPSNVYVAHIPCWPEGISHHQTESLDHPSDRWCSSPILQVDLLMLHIGTIMHQHTAQIISASLEATANSKLCQAEPCTDFARPS